MGYITDRNRKVASINTNNFIIRNRGFLGEGVYTCLLKLRAIADDYLEVKFQLPTKETHIERWAYSTRDLGWELRQFRACLPINLKLQQYLDTLSIHQFIEVFNEVKIKIKVEFKNGYKLQNIDGQYFATLNGNKISEIYNTIGEVNAEMIRKGIPKGLHKTTKYRIAPQSLQYITGKADKYYEQHA